MFSSYLMTSEHSLPIQIVFLRSNRIRVDLLSYDSKSTAKREQYDWMTEKKLNGYRGLTPAAAFLVFGINALPDLLQPAPEDQ